MDWSLGLESWSGVLEWILGVEPWNAADVLAMCILWSGVMDLSLGLESWSGVLEWILGVEPWNEIFSVTENSILVVKLSRGERPPSQNV